MQLGLGLGLTHVQQAVGLGGGETLEVIDFADNEEITEYVNNDVTAVTTYVDFTGCTQMLLFRALLLETVTENFSCTSSGIVVADCPSLTSVGGDGLNFSFCVDFTTPDFSALETVTGIGCQGCLLLTSFPLPALTTVGAGGLNFQDCTGLISFAIQALETVADGGTFNFFGCALDQVSVDAILVALAATAFANGVVDLSGGTNARPSATGRTAKATLVARGCTVTDNGTLTSIEFVGDTEITEYVEEDLVVVSEGIVFSNCTSLVTVAIPDLEEVITGDLQITGCPVVTVDLSSLVEVTDNMSIQGEATLTDFDISALETINGVLSIAALFVVFSLPATLKELHNVAITAALNQASVDGVLESLVALDGTGDTTLYENQTVDLSGGTNAVPSAAGLTAKATLEGRGNTVIVNE